jgi:hypothetical protein
VVLIGRDEDNAVSGYWLFALLTPDYSLPVKDVYLMFPGVRMGRSRAAGLNLEDAHAEVWCPVVGVDNLALEDSG